MLLVIASLWIWVFVPSWFKRSEERQSERKFAGQIKSEIKTAKKQSVSKPGSIAALAARNYRLAMTRRVFGTVLLSALVAAVFFAVQAPTNPMLWLAAGGSLAMAVLSVVILRKATAKARELISKSARTRSSIYAETAYVAVSSAQVDERAWEPNPLPAPRERIGALEVPELAQVISIEPARQLSSSELDEILRRRRANG